MRKTVKRIGWVLLMAWLTMSNSSIFSQEVSVWSKIDTSAIMIGEQTTMEIGMNMPEDFVAIWPAFTDTLSKEIEVVKKLSIDTLTDSGLLRLKQKLVITSFDSGGFTIPSSVFQYAKPNDTTIYSTSTGTLFLQVNVPVVDTTQAIKPIVGPMDEPLTFGEILPWILIGLAALAAILLAIYFIRKYKRKEPLFERKAKPALPPHVVAITKLEELRLARIWQHGKVKQYHSSLTDIVREYLEKRYLFNAPELTSDEILEKLQSLKVNREAYDKLNGVFFLSDMVKFAKAQPTALENDLSLSHCIDFVNETKAEDQITEQVDKPSVSTTNV